MLRVQEAPNTALCRPLYVLGLDVACTQGQAKMKLTLTSLLQLD
jgi:hypothetical protein